MNYQILTSPIPLLFDPPFVIGLFLLGTAVGLRVLLLLGARRGDLSRLEWGVLCCMVGLGALQYVPFVLSAVRQLNTRGIWIALAVLAVCSLPQLALVVRNIVRACGLLRNVRTAPWQTAAVGIAAVPLLLAFLQAVCPCTDADGMAYHLGGPKRWLQEGTLSYLPSFRHTQTPVGQDMLYLLALGVWSDTAAKLIHFGLGLVAGLGLFAVVRRMAGPAPALLVSLVFVIGLPGFVTLQLMTWAYNEMGVAAQLAAFLIAWHAWLRNDKPGMFRALLLMAGLLITYKITNVLFVVAAALVGAVWRTRSKMPLARTAREALLMVAACVVVPLPWFVRSWWQTGNPVWPLASSFFPTADWNPEAARFFSRHFRLEIWGTGRLGALTDDQRVWLLLGALIVVLVATLVASARLKDPWTRALLLVTGITVASSMWFTGLYLRYFVPLFLPALACAAGAWRAQLGRPAGQWTVVTLLAVSGALYIRTAYPPALTAARTATGIMPREDYLTQMLPYYPIAKKVNAELPAEAVIMTAGGIQQFYFDRPLVYVDNARIRYREWEQYLSDIRRSRVTHVLAAGAFFEPALGLQSDNNYYFFLRRLVSEHGEMLVEQPDRLYVLSRGWSLEESTP